MITRKTFSVTLTTTDPIRIGGKEDPLAAADNPTSVVGGRVCIPGPSLKGALRAEIEAHLIDTCFRQGAWPQNELPSQPCIPSTKPTRDEERLIREGRFRRSACRYPGNDGICPACYILGAQGLVGFVSVPFLFTDVSYGELYSTRLDRTRRTVVQGTNRPYQHVPPGAKFVGALEVTVSDSILGWSLGQPRKLAESAKGDAWLSDGKWSGDRIIKELIVDRFQAIRSIGGYRSKGFGGVAINVKENAQRGA